MCMVSYIPLENGFVIASNRDESLQRSKVLYPEMDANNVKQIVYPKDIVSNGTWIIVNEEGEAGVLLNGAAGNNLVQPVNKKSRGRLLINMFSHKNKLLYLATQNLSDFPPFTIVLLERQHLFEIQWDVKKLRIKPLNIKLPYLWLSNTLYTSDEQRVMQSNLKQAMKQTKLSKLNRLKQFHQQHRLNISFDAFKINAEGLKIYTLSSTYLTVEGNKVTMQFDDYIRPISSVFDFAISNFGLISHSISMVNYEIFQNN